MTGLGIQIERSLVIHYLHSDGPYEGTPLRYIDATRTELAKALGHENPIEILVRSCGSASEVAKVFAYGFSGHWPDRDAPGFIRYLVLSCAIVAAADSNAETRNFRRNLAAAFGNQVTFSKLDALPNLWERLANWSKARRKLGEPIREVFLPPPLSWQSIGIHVGLTQYITFPAWRDLSHLRTVITHNAELHNIQDPFDAARRLPRRIEYDHRFSDALRKASDEYRELYAAKASMLRTHRFWTVVQGVLNNGKSPRAKRQIRVALRFALDLDDTEMSFSVVDRTSDRNFEVPDTRMDGCPDQMMADLPKWLAKNGFASTSYPLSHQLLSNVIPFFEERFGVWVADFRLTEYPRKCVVLFKKSKQSSLAGIIRNPRVVGESYFLSEILSHSQLQGLFRLLGLKVQGDDSFTFRRDALEILGGFKTKFGFLGRLHLLPQFETPETGNLTISPLQAQLGEVSIEPMSQVSHRLITQGPLSGSYRVRLEEVILDDVDALSQEITVTFTPDAVEHPKLGNPDPRHWEKPVEMDAGIPIPSSPNGKPSVTAPPTIEPSERFVDLMEAIYALGRSGWTEAELLETIREILGNDVASPWDIVRSLEEAGWLFATNATKWRARRWWLCAPTLFVPSCQQQS